MRKRAIKNQSHREPAVCASAPIDAKQKAAVIIHIAALMQDLGMSTTEAASMLSALALVSIIGRLLMGWLGDRIGIRTVYIGSLVTLVAGLVVVASAGNLGKLADGTPVSGGITVPGTCPHSLTIGALNTKGTIFRSDDVVASYSSKGPTRYDHLIKPDLVAPGRRLPAAIPVASTLGTSLADRLICVKDCAATTFGRSVVTPKLFCWAEPSRTVNG